MQARVTGKPAKLAAEFFEAFDLAFDFFEGSFPGVFGGEEAGEIPGVGSGNLITSEADDGRHF